MSIPKIAVEEHFIPPELIDSYEKFYPAPKWPALRNALLDTHGQLLATMDASGVEMTLLSLSSPGIQGIPARQQAIEMARRLNDFLAEQVAKRPDRFQGFAALPLQDPDAAAKELVRCVHELGFKGAMINGFSQIDKEDSMVYYDLPQYRPFWATAESLDVPCYMHPRYPVEEPRNIEGHPWLRGAAWSFGVEAATHALRLITCGLFDQYPKLTIILGHLGEMLPSAIWRLDHRVKVFKRGFPAKRTPLDCFRNNFYVSTSGNFCTHLLLDAILTLGVDRVLFAADYPFEDMAEGAAWFDQLDVISETDRIKIARTNAERLFKLGRPVKEPTLSPA
ncbi:MAG TPA: amidohydrolase family protein [Patescibacteria group bacterium]|nr:amidohydrolase family protein [Patescibacteria group bacterium]